MNNKEVPADSPVTYGYIELTTEFGPLRVAHIEDGAKEGLLVIGKEPLADPVPVRLQSSCVFSESLRSVDCDCADQLQESLRIAASEGGIVVYIYEEGRGAGLRKKIEAIRIQQELGLDTAAAFDRLGLPSDPRTFEMAARVLEKLIKKEQPIALLTNNRLKVEALRSMGFAKVSRRRLVVERGPLGASVKKYLQEKARALGHLIDEDDDV
jgi:GTP cyclohydrolase II